MLFRVTLAAVLVAVAAPVVGAQQPAPARPAPAGPATTRPAPTASAPSASASTTPGLPSFASAADTAPPAPQDQARGMDAEIRVALFDLLENNTVPALRRLQALASTPVPMDSGHAAALRGRPDVLFLLAEAQYRFGMDSAFSATAQSVLSAPGVPSKYTSLLRAQELLAAYRAGDYAHAVQMASGMTQDETRGLASLVSGLASYQLHNYNTARTAFATAERTGGEYASFARYMDVLAGLRTDTSQTVPAIAALRSLAGGLQGEFADQVRLTAAQVAYQAGRYDDAASIAGDIAPTSGVGAQALLTRGWALYKAGNVAGAQLAFDAFAARYPQLPERDESRLMAAQALLQLGRTGDAGRIFHDVADSATGEVKLLQARSADAMAEGARALVAARAAGLLFIDDPSTGKTVALQDAAGADRQELLAAVSPDSAAAAPAVTPGRIIAVSDVAARVDSLGPTVTATVPQRLFFAPSAASTAGAFATRSQALLAADVSLALARYDLGESMRRQAMQIAMMQQLQSLLAGRHDSLATLASGLDATQQQLASLMSRLDAARAKIMQMLSEQAQLTNAAAAENLHVLDSLRTNLPTVNDQDRSTLDLEYQSAQRYQAIANMLTGRLADIVAHSPAFALRDSVRARGDSVRGLLAGTQQALATAEQLVAGELSRLQSNGPADQARLNAAIAAARSGRDAAEQRLVAAVEAELRGRATEMIAALGRDAEAASFGTASASFFQALDQQQGQGGAVGTTGASAAAMTSAPVASAVTYPQKQK